MASRRAQWERLTGAAQAEAGDKVLVSKQKRTTTSTSRIMEAGRVVSVTQRVSVNAPAQINYPPPPPAHAPGSSDIPSDDPASSKDPIQSDDAVPKNANQDVEQTLELPPTDRTQFWDQFEKEKDHMADLLYHQHSSEGYGEACSSCLSGATATVRCSDCWHRVPTCEDCFIAAHSRMPTHWAEVWSLERGFTIRCDMSALCSKPHIQMGHASGQCPNSFADKLRHEFLIIDTNGIHSTRLRFCTCQGADTPVAQLMKANLFPATLTKPKTAFTFAVLKQYHIHHLESAESAYGFIAALRRLTDPFFFEDAADPYNQFRDVFKMWRILLAEKRYGHNHNIDSVLLDRPPGHLAVGCPTCPEQNVNTDRSVQWPRELRHLKQVRLTLDGNYHANHLIKHSDPNLVSYFEGRAFFPEPEPFELVMKGLGLDINEKPTCAYLKAVSKQETKKFIGCDISGIVNIQCPHVFIVSTVNLKGGEKFGLSDFGLVQGLRWRYLPLLKAPDRHDIRPPKVSSSSNSQPAMHPAPAVQPLHCLTPPPEPTPSLRPHTDKPDNVSTALSYDIICSWHVNVDDRMKEQYPDVYPFFENCQYTIPLLHIQNHKDNCTYLYSSAFAIGAGHFHGETAEHPWVYVNQFGGQGRQMSHGNRHDLYADVFNNWNWKKYINLPAQLFNELTRAKRHRLSKRNVFLGLCKLYHDKIAVWDLLDRQARTKDGNKEVMCVYRHNPSNIPSQAQVYEVLASMNKETLSSKATVPALIDRSIELVRLQQKIKQKLAFNKAHGELPSIQSDITTLRNRLERQLKSFRDLQLALFPHLEIVIQGAKSGETAPVEDQILYTPSYFDQKQRDLLRLTEAGNMERTLWEGAIYDVLSQLRTHIRYVSSLVSEKSANASGQGPKTRAMSKVQDAEFLRDYDMAVYSAGRACMLNLGLSPDDPHFPPMTIRSTFRKSTDAAPGLGTTYAPDGLIWTLSMGGDTRRLTFAPLINTQAVDEQDKVTTQSQQRPKRKNDVTAHNTNKKAKMAPPATDAPVPNEAQDSTSYSQAIPSNAQAQTGWIWRISPPHGVTSQQIEDWMSEGDRVQWFRAEAEMMRWQEEYELKLVEFVRAIRHYETMAAAWLRLSEALGNVEKEGKAAYARKTAARYREQARRCSSIFYKQAGFPDLIDEATVLEHVLNSREELRTLRAAAFSDRVSKDPSQ
ncbi:hypothetical protein BKA70DRAFT_1502308 [Coprinopsis sp. MPI-PUGE-AT-0042]|nr:hypothetical protein BKA70DRAFT_1502308 [Coprinopsis sp. MPI-PUGE-AT-0042]